MCFRKVDCMMWIRYEGGKAMLWLRAGGDGSCYDDFFTIERVLPGAQGVEELATLPFGDIANITYDTSYAPDLCSISFDMGSDVRFANIEVERHCFNLFLVRKMIRIWKKGK